MRITEVIQTADDIHSGDQGLCFAGQSACAAGQAGKPLAEGGVEALDKGGIDPARSLGNLDQTPDHCLTALNDAPIDVQMIGTALLEHLDDGDVGPGDELRASFFTPAAGHSRAKSRLESGHVTRQTIDGQQQGAAQGDLAHLLRQGLDQDQISPGAYRTAQPQPGGDHQRQGHPESSLLGLDFDLIGLHLLQIQVGAAHGVFMHGLTVLTGPLPAVPHRALIKAKRLDYRLNGTAVGQERHHQQHRLGTCPQPVKYRTFAGAKGLFAYFTDVTLFLLTMHLNVAFSALTSCRTLNIRAKYSLWVHWVLSWLLGRFQECASEPRFYQVLSSITL